MSTPFIAAVRHAKLNFIRSTNLEAKYVIIGRDFIDDFMATKASAESLWGYVSSGDELRVLGMKAVIAPWTTGLTILPDVATCDTFACVTPEQQP